MPPRGNQPQERVCAANWRRSLCAAKRDPRPRGYTPLGFPKRRSQRARATRTQYYCSRLTPAPSAPFRNSGVPPNPRRGEREAPLSKGAGCVSGLGDSDGLCVAAHSRAISVQCKGAGCRPPLPLSSATRSRQSVGRGLDPSAAFRPTIVTGSSVGEGFIPPGAFAFPLASGPPPPTLSQLYHTLFPPPLQGVVKISLQIFLSICVIIEKV